MTSKQWKVVLALCRVVLFLAVQKTKPIGVTRSLAVLRKALKESHD